jgi:hypothetical protein
MLYFDWIKVQFTAVKVWLLTHSWNCLTKWWRHFLRIGKLIKYIVSSILWRKHHNQKVPWNTGYWQKHIWRMKYTVRTLICFTRPFLLRIFSPFYGSVDRKSPILYIFHILVILYQLVPSFLISSTKCKISNLLVIQSYKSYLLHTLMALWNGALCLLKIMGIFTCEETVTSYYAFCTYGTETACL